MAEECEMYEVDFHYHIVFPEGLEEFNGKKDINVYCPVRVPVLAVDEESIITAQARNALTRFVFESVATKPRVLGRRTKTVEVMESGATLVCITLSEVEQDGGLTPIPLRPWMEELLERTMLEHEQS